MNLIKETQRRLEYQHAKLVDLQECIEQPVTDDCKRYLNSQMENVTDNIKYYSELLEVLEIANKVL
jgi:hypothetical protein